MKTSTIIQTPPATSDEHMLFAPHPELATHRKQLLENLGTFRNPTAKTAKALRGIRYYDLPPEVMNHMRTRSPKVSPETWGRIRQFVEDAVSVTAPQLPYAAGLVQSTAAAYVEWVVMEKHLPLDGKIIWSRQMIDLYVTDEMSHLKPGTRRNYRAYLDRVSKILCPEEHAYEYTPQNRKSSVAPYSAAEMDRFRNWAANQSNPLKRRRGVAMLALCAGAGLSSSEVAQITSAHVDVSNSGIVIDVPGKRTRRVPLLPDWDEWMLAVTEDCTKGERLWGPIARKDYSNLLSTFVENAEGKGNGPRSDRLRNTWLVWHLQNRTPMKDLLYAAGVRKMEQLPRLLEHCEFLPASDYVAVLRGEAI
ncbi:MULTISPECIES: hypothetical protein [unclassified Leucobacter]|uniref:hypothetical protein n=1 Tax=unclassified Leucobacter TaxID=2621730 RepID=UPI00165DE0B4|nr:MULTISPECIES: hypothetical protein [unclassified Leucobacter]MBC9926958.1 hypothetical protein [Leucobacter sp. cx-169]